MKENVLMCSDARRMSAIFLLSTVPVPQFLFARLREQFLSFLRSYGIVSNICFSVLSVKLDTVRVPYILSSLKPQEIDIFLWRPVLPGVHSVPTYLVLPILKQFFIRKLWVKGWFLENCDRTEHKLCDTCSIWYIFVPFLYLFFQKTWILRIYL